jgi:hypothetical protein
MQTVKRFSRPICVIRLIKSYLECFISLSAESVAVQLFVQARMMAQIVSDLLKVYFFAKKTTFKSYPVHVRVNLFKKMKSLIVLYTNWKVNMCLLVHMKLHTYKHMYIVCDDCMLNICRSSLSESGGSWSTYVCTWRHCGTHL